MFELGMITAALAASVGSVAMTHLADLMEIKNAHHK